MDYLRSVIPPFRAMAAPKEIRANDPSADGNPGGLGAFLKRAFGLGAPFQVREWKLLVALALFLIMAHDSVFFSKVLEIYPAGRRYLLFHASVLLVLTGLTTFLLALVSSRFTTKVIATILLLASALVSHFTDTYGVVVDVQMLRNVIETNWSETLDLVSGRMILRLLLLGVLPAAIVWHLRIVRTTFWHAVLARVALAAMSLAVVAAALFSSAATFASFFREHKSVRAYVNPLGYLFAAGKLVAMSGTQGPVTIIPLATDARRGKPGVMPRLVLLVVGETARADHFSLNGYTRETNPLLSREDIVNFPNVLAAGTSTGISVPSMFSHLGREHYDPDIAHRTENVLDILARTGVSVLWRDNNSDSKGVAARVAFEDFRDPTRNPIKDEEARDEGMLVDLQSYIDRQPGDVLVVLHTMGSHGPAYYKRYPKAFEVFTPVCRSNQLEQCTPAEIINAYDNTILYTDYFLSKAIELLKRNDAHYETALLYFSDHGESLGESNLYLHGYPYAVAPVAQKHIPALFWFGIRFPVNRAKMRRHAANPYSHDNLFHTLLGLYAVETAAYRAPLDMVSPFLTAQPKHPPANPVH